MLYIQNKLNYWMNACGLGIYFFDHGIVPVNVWGRGGGSIQQKDYLKLNPHIAFELLKFLVPWRAFSPYQGPRCAMCPTCGSQILILHSWQNLRRPLHPNKHGHVAFCLRNRCPTLPPSSPIPFKSNPLLSESFFFPSLW